MSCIAVIGSGISGLAAAYYLSRKHEVSLFEREERIGGHTHTVTVESSRGPLRVDTGFIVHNDRTYPNLIRLLEELRVPRVNSDMSFAVSCRRTGYEYSSRGLRGYFAQKHNVWKPSSHALFGEIRRFNRTVPRLLDRPDASRLKLGDFLDEHRFTQYFREFYLFPMASAIRFPHTAENLGLHYASTLSLWRERFFRNLAAVRQLGFDDRFQRMWDFYLKLERGSISGALHQRGATALRKKWFETRPGRRPGLEQSDGLWRVRSLSPFQSPSN